jgi:hypothetical protein
MRDKDAADRIVLELALDVFWSQTKGCEPDG